MIAYFTSQFTKFSSQKTRQLTHHSPHVTILLVFKPLLGSILDLIYPQTCIFCKESIQTQEKTPLCQICRNAIQKNKPPFCSLCSRYLEDQMNPLCSTCLKTNPHFDMAWASSLYDDTMQKLIHLFKYGQKTSLQYYFGELMLEFITTYRLKIEQFDVVTPIPLHSTRLRERGFNQAQLLAEKIAQTFHIQQSNHNLVRIKNTQNQARLSQKDRWTNIRGAFKIKDIAAFAHKSVLLVDDLLTTGATASEVARILKTAGAKKVGVLTVAIAI